MDEQGLSHKKRRHKPHYASSDYHSRYKQRIGNQRDEWRPDFREKDNRYIDRQEKEHQGNQYRDAADTLWDVEINLIGQKDPNPMIHLCDTCRLPIRSYGRLIPCKHVFCFKCAKKTDKNCPRCGDEVHRIEQCRHGTVWMCVVSNCSRTYLSQRDLQAHVNHRHAKPPPPPGLPAMSTAPPPPHNIPPPQLPGAILVPPPPVSTISQLSNGSQLSSFVIMPNVSTNQALPPVTIPPPENPVIPTSQSTDMIARPSSNLITIQIQDDQQTSLPFPQVSEQNPSTSKYSAPPPISTNLQISQPRTNMINSNVPWLTARAQNHGSNY